MSARRVDLGPAIAGIAEATGGDAREARFALFSSLRRDEIRATAEEAIYIAECREPVTQQAVELPPDLWKGIDAEQSHSFDQPDVVLFPDGRRGSMVARLIHMDRRELSDLWPSAKFASGNPYARLFVEPRAPLLVTASAATAGGLRRPGRVPELRSRVEAEMRAIPPDELRNLKLKQMADQFRASQTTCSEVRRHVLAH